MGPLTSLSLRVLSDKTSAPQQGLFDRALVKIKEAAGARPEPAMRGALVVFIIALLICLALVLLGPTRSDGLTGWSASPACGRACRGSAWHTLENRLCCRTGSEVDGPLQARAGHVAGATWCARSYSRPVPRTVSCTGRCSHKLALRPTLGMPC